MTTTITTAEAIRTALAAMTGGVFSEKAGNLLAALGYRSDHVPPTLPASVGDFIAEHPAPNPGTQSETAFADNAQSVRILFQFTDAEITSTTQRALLNDEELSTGNARSFLFVAVELKGDNYARGQYVAFTREINKRWQIPTVVLFRTATNHATLAFVHRRPNRRDPERDVLGSVSLIREIDTANPHRAHLDILAELSLTERLLWMDRHVKPHNFDGLLEAWLDALDTEELNRRFYRDLFDWFQRAVATATFPAAATQTVSAEEHIIRLITRLLFVWFIKEKDLVADDLFIEYRVSQLLKDYDADAGDSYYRAVLQNLFFATLNTEIIERRFSQRGNDDNPDLSAYRYFDEMADPDALLESFSLTPFINGGLFDCLDSFDTTGAGDIRIDCFTDNARHRRGYSIPNRLFFDENGLITLFNRYKFTVEENTPADREVALDPELLGKVFENLLAAFNPETKENARKQTGSYYTPRAVVDYMVDEALVATLAQKAAPGEGDTDFLQERLGYLLDYDVADAHTLFEAEEKTVIVSAIADTKVLDPAVGSGAFPMGVLHKLTLALRRLDPGNHLWADLQRKQARRRAGEAFNTENQVARDAELEEISATFERYRDSDFGRKLYLIQNSIYGVDIQPIATQIAKLRFFISLAIDQNPTGDVDDNYGIKPLPNLETRFVAANSLIGLERPSQMALGETDEVKELRGQLYRNRERYFHAKTRQLKMGLRDEDKRLRHGLAAALQEADFSAGDADNISKWNPYDQNSSASWFDAEYMFGVKDGFDLVIANPPYINVENLTDAMRSYLLTHYQSCEKRTDIYVAFLEKAFTELGGRGLLCYILPTAFTKQQYATKIRQQIIAHRSVRQLVDASAYRIFENAVVYNVVLLAEKGKKDNACRIRLHQSNADFENRTGVEFLVDQSSFASLKDCRIDTNPFILDSIPLKDKIWTSAIPLGDICLISYGARLNSQVTGVDKTYYLSDEFFRGAKLFCEGHSIQRYSFSQTGWLNYQPSEHYRPVFPELFNSEKLMAINIVKERLRFAYDGGGCYNSHTVINCVRLDLLRDVSHRSAKQAVAQADMPAVRQFAYKYLLAMLNSRLVSWYFTVFLSEGLHFYPNDAKQLPIPKLDAIEQRPFVRLVDRILDAKAVDPSADTAMLEAEIDRRVYAFYGLTEEEIAAVEEQ